MEQKPDISSTGAAKAEADPAYVNLKVKQQVRPPPLKINAPDPTPHDFQDGAVTHFRIKRSTQMKKASVHSLCCVILAAPVISKNLMHHAIPHPPPLPPPPSFAAHRFILPAPIARCSRRQVCSLSILFAVGAAFLISNFTFPRPPPLQIYVRGQHNPAQRNPRRSRCGRLHLFEFAAIFNANAGMEDDDEIDAMLSQVWRIVARSCRHLLARARSLSILTPKITRLAAAFDANSFSTSSASARIRPQ